MEKKVYLLSSKEGIHLIASNLKVIYMALQNLVGTNKETNLKSYSWYCFYLSNYQDIPVALKQGGTFTISKRPIISKYIGHLAPKSCTIPTFKKV